MSVATSIDAAAQALADARHVLALTGAGISAESGIPTFREAQTGLWAQYSPEDLATPAAFARDPDRVWGWYRWRRTLIARGGVNAGHRALADLESVRAVSVVTQNVDGLHAAAGSHDIAELHGNIWRDRCSACDHCETRPVAAAEDDAPLPRCPTCSALMRPDVVWFGEMLPMAALDHAQHALKRADCVLVIGTSNRVYPAAALVDDAVRSSVPVVEINPQPTPVSNAVDVCLADTASRALPALLDALDAGAR